MNIQIPSPVTFEQAIELTQHLLEQLQTGNLSPKEIEIFVRELVNSENGARGFFVAYLSDKIPLEAPYFQSVISALKTSPKIVNELLTKNVAMSTAMAITHTRNQDPQMAQNSQNVQERAVNIIRSLETPDLIAELHQLRQTIETDEGSYQQFLKRFNYDSEQRQAIHEIITKVI